MRDQKVLTLDEVAIKESARLYRERVMKSLGGVITPQVSDVDDSALAIRSGTVDNKHSIK